LNLIFPLNIPLVVISSLPVINFKNGVFNDNSFPRSSVSAGSAIIKFRRPFDLLNVSSNAPCLWADVKNVFSVVDI